MVDPVCTTIANVGTCNETAVGAAVDGASSDRYAISVDRECGQASLEAGCEIRFAARTGDRHSPPGATLGRIEADEIELSTAALIDIVWGAPFKVVEKTIRWHRVAEWSAEEALLVLLVMPRGPPHGAAGTVDGSNPPWRMGAEAPACVEGLIGKRRSEEAGMIGVRGLVLTDGWRLEAGP